MFFSNPIWLWGLTALSIPVGIHLLSRKESLVMKLGSLRHLQESITKQSVNIRLNEWVLLALRCLMIMLLTLLLSGLHFATDGVAHERWLFIEKNLEHDSEFTAVIDSLKKTGFETKQLHSAFAGEAAPNGDSTVNYWKLVEGIQRYNPEQVVVLSNTRLEQFKGKRLAKPEQVTWLSKDQEPHKFSVQAIAVNNDSIMVRTGYTLECRTSFENLPVLSQKFPDALTIDPRDTINIILASDKPFAYDNRILLAALHSLDDSTLPLLSTTVVATAEVQTATGDWLIWLSDKALPEQLNANILVMASTSAENIPLLRQDKACKDGYTCWTITRRLTVDEALRHNLALELSTLLFEDTRKRLEHETKKNDRRVQPEAMMWSKTPLEADINSTAKAGHSEVLQLLAALLLAALVTERFIAFRRHQ